MSWTYTGTASNDSISPPAAQGTYIIDGGAGTDTVNTNALYVQGAFTYSQNPVTGITTLSGASGTGLVMYLHNVEFVSFTNGTWTVPALTDTTPPTVATFSPSSAGIGVAINSNIVVTFSEAIQRGTGNILLKNSAGATIEAFDAATSNLITISGATLTLNPTNDLANNTNYFVTFDPGTIKDITGNNYAGSTSYNFTTIAWPW